MTAKPLSRSGRVYIGSVAIVGAVVLTFAILESRNNLSGQAQAYPWLILGALTWASSSFVTRMPGGASLYISEAFVFASMLLFGPGPAVVTMAIDGLLLSLRHRNRTVARYLFHVTEPAITTWMAGLVLKLSGVAPIALAAAAKRFELSELAMPVLGMATVYFSVNLCLNAVAVMTESGVGALRAWRTQVAGLGFSTIAGASLGLLIAINVPLSNGVWNLSGGWGSVAGLVLIVPLMLISYFTFQTSVARVEEANHHLNELNELYLSTVETLAMAIDAKDQVTHGHIRRVQSYAVGLARALGLNNETEVKAIEAAALLHDMGKLSVPEFILNKPGKLTAAEYERMKLHAPVGASILSQINFPYPVVPIVRHHHENWDGTGYPDHIGGENIPLGARIMAVVDCYDALISDRPYRPALTDEQALAIITERRGTMYDPRVVDVFFEVYREIGPPHADVGEAEHHDLIHMPRAPLQALPEDETSEAAACSTSSADEILLLCELAEGLGGHATLDDVAEMMTRHLRRMVPAPLAVFYLLDERSGELVARHASGLGDDRLDGLRMSLGAGLSGWVAANRTTIVNSNPALDLGERLRTLSPLLESALSAPLISENELIGVLTLYAAARNAFTDDHRRVVELVARQIADAFCRATIFERDQASALRDGVTGLPNARSLGQLLASRGFADTQNSLSFGVLCFACGPDDAPDAVPGEVLLVRVAAATKKVLRATDLVFRYNSHEIVILMPDTGPTATWRIARRIVASVEQTPLGSELPIQVGLAFAPTDGRSIDVLLDKARGRLERQRWLPAVADEPAFVSRLEN
jgi:putative nucleotidyltransferase with HDIG domain/diguanylate cyclase (GGDEF)-like protein